MNLLDLGFQARFGRLQILIYHRVLEDFDPLRADEVTIKRFRKHCQWLSSSFNVLPLPEAFHRLQEGTLPPRATCITFDDGYQDNVTHALPILKSFRLNATFFIATGFLNQTNMFNDVIIETLRPFDGTLHLKTGTYDCSNLTGKLQAIRHLIQSIKPLSPTERALALADELQSTKLAPLMMTDIGVKKLASAGMHIGAHTINHPILAKLTEGEALSEIEGSKTYLENLLGRSIAWFAYPNGQWQKDFLPVHAQMVKNLNFDGALATDWGAATLGSDRYRLPRFTPWHTTELKFRAKMMQVRLFQPV